MLYCAQVTIDEQFFHHSFVYPDFSAEPKDLQEFIAADLLEVSHKRALERSGEGCVVRAWSLGHVRGCGLIGEGVV